MPPYHADDYKQGMEQPERGTPTEQWVERATSISGVYKQSTQPADVYETHQGQRTRHTHNAQQRDQWAVLRHEVEGAGMNRPDDATHVQWGAGVHDTDGGPLSPSLQPEYSMHPTHPAPPTHAAFSPFNPYAHTQHNVDIVVVGVGGGGMNAINRMMSARVRGVRFVAMNTDAQVLALSPAGQRVSLGHQHTKGLGAGGNAATGERAAYESTDQIRQALGNPDLVFIAAGMGGGTGTGAAPVVASIARKLGALTVGIVTLPFTFEGTRRRRVAQDGINALSEQIDALITVPNDRLLATVGRDYNLTDAFKIADDVLRQGVQGIAEVINVPGMVNVDFADVRSVLREAGTALMSIGHGQGRNRAQRAADEAIAGGFLNVTIRGARRVLFNISGGEDMTLFEVNDVAERIGQAIDDAADITFGAVIDPSLHDSIRVTLIAAGMEELHTMRLQAVRPDARPSSVYTTGTNQQQLQRSQPPAQQVSPVRPGTAQQPIPPVRAAGYPSTVSTTSTGETHAVAREPVAEVPFASRSSSYQQGQTPYTHRDANAAWSRRQESQPAQDNQPVAQPVQPGTPQGQHPQHPVRPQRSLDDLRGLRSMGRRYSRPSEDENDIPPFMRPRES